MPDAPVVFAVAAHPDDIEFMMVGTMLRLKERGWDLHYLNIANGSCGTATELKEAIIARRRGESIDACELIGATYHESLCDDLDVYHTTEIVSRVVSAVRTARPRIMLLPSPQDYMEDHMNASRVAVTAAFARGMRNYACTPDVAPTTDDVTLYHALPYGLHGPMRERIHPGQYVDIGPTIQTKRDMLARHRSQKEWLDTSQGLDAYLDTMEGFARDVGKMSGAFEFAEGWRRRSHLGFTGEDTDPLTDALGDAALVDPDYERALQV